MRGASSSVGSALSVDLASSMWCDNQPDLLQEMVRPL
jgi:hypothetical protein